MLARRGAAAPAHAHMPSWRQYALLACAPAHLVTCKPCLGGEGAAHRYSAPARPYLATRKLCLAASPRRIDGAQLLLLAYAWRHRDIKQRRTCVHAHLTTCERCSDARRGGRAETRSGRHAGSTQPLACVHAHLATNRPRSAYAPNSIPSLRARMHRCVHVGSPSRRVCAPACLRQCSLLCAAGQQHSGVPR